MKVGLEKLEIHEWVAVKALLDSGATGLFMDTAFAKEKGFKMEKMKKPLCHKLHLAISPPILRRFPRS